MAFLAILGREVSCACSGKRGNLEEYGLFYLLFCCFLSVLIVLECPTIARKQSNNLTSLVKVFDAARSNVLCRIYTWRTFIEIGRIMETAGDSDLTGEKQNEGR